MAEENTSGEKTEERKNVTREDFVTKWPLYTLASVPLFYPPERVSFHCDDCGKETTWIRMKDPQEISIQNVNLQFHWVWYSCGLCGKRHLITVYREAGWEQRPTVRSSSGIHSGSFAPTPRSTTSVATKFQKIGQFPALSIDVPKGLQRNLGEEGIGLYKKALINRNSGFGLGAITYIRRVVEDKTNELIEVAAKLAESHHVGANIVESIRAAATERTTYDQKLKIAATVLPEALLIDGVNPLGELYNLVSEGVHGLSEEECIAVADETTSVFEFIFTNLRAQTQARQGFVEKVTKWAGRGKAQRT
jgi:hypothetical protein